MQQRPRKKWLWRAGFLLAIIAVAAIAAGPIMSRVEQPEYRVEAKDGAFEVRAYPAIIVAETEVTGERRPAISEGFSRIAGYIFGKNAPKAKIDMTAPVQQQKQTIAMTAPVTQQGNGAAWTVQFIMPKSWTMETLPAPLDNRVKLRQIAPRKFAVVTFSGFARSSVLDEKTAELRRFAEARKLSTVGEPVFAFYNPPWTLPFFRRNEIMLEIAP
jgi:hypothetical protein